MMVHVTCQGKKRNHGARGVLDELLLHLLILRPQPRAMGSGHGADGMATGPWIGGVTVFVKTGFAPKASTSCISRILVFIGSVDTFFSQHGSFCEKKRAASTCEFVCRSWTP